MRSTSKERYRQMCELAACVYTDEELKNAPGIHMGASLADIVKRGAYLLTKGVELNYLAHNTWDDWYYAWCPHIEQALKKTDEL